jgi:RNA polymerase sigma-70 factor (ECF subfamily)
MGQTAVRVPKRRQTTEERLLQAFAETRAELLHTLTLVLGSSDDAQDAVQESFLKCWQHRQRSVEVINLRAWIFRVGLNTARDLQRSAWRRRVRSLDPLVSPDEPVENSPTEQLLHAETLERLRQALGHLRTEEREVFLLRQNSDLTYDQIAVLRRTPVGTIKTQMRTALHKLRGVLQEKPEEVS